MTAGSVRARVREEMTREIKETARAHLAREGAGALSLRAVARDMGMASSALYRYYPTRDHLLTALIVEGYDAIGEAAEEADRAARAAATGGGAYGEEGASAHRARWAAVCGAVRAWALTHPQEYALLYGSPVPGYHAPEDTVGPAGRVALVLGGIASDAAGAGLAWPAPGPAPPPPVLADARALRESALPGVPEEVLARGLLAWTALYGLISFELFGHYRNVVSDLDAYFRYCTEVLGSLAGAG